MVNKGVHDVELEGKLVLMKKCEGFETEKDRLFLCTGGFGCSPGSLGTKIFGFTLNKGEKFYIRRENISSVVEITEDLQKRIDEVKAFRKKLSETCERCGGPARFGDGKTALNVLTGRPICKDCREKDKKEEEEKKAREQEQAEKARAAVGTLSEM